MRLTSIQLLISCFNFVVLNGAVFENTSPGSTCALDPSNPCPLPSWPPTYNLTESSIVYQPWCINDGDPYLCTGLLNVTAWWGREDNRDRYSIGQAHWGLISIDDSTSTQMWAGTTYGNATPGNPNTFAAQKSMLDNCINVRKNGWANRCFVYDNMVVSLGWYESHRAIMDQPSYWSYFNIMNNNNNSLNLTNYTGLPFLEPLGDLTPCWNLPNTSEGFDQHQWCGPNMQDIRLPCFSQGTCNVSSGNGEGVSFYWNYSAVGASDWRVRDNLAFVLNGGDGVDGLFTDEMEMFPGDGGDVYLRILGTDEADAQQQQADGRTAHQRMINELVSNGKYLWQAFQSGNDVGKNNNNNTIGGLYHDVNYCIDWMTQRCNTDWVNQRAITVQFDSENVNVSIASFLIVRPNYAWIGYGAGYYQPKWNDAFLWDVGEPIGECQNGTRPGVFVREWTYGTAIMDCNSYTALVPCNPADKSCGQPPQPPPPPPGPTGNWTVHNCTSCQTPPASPLQEYTNLSLDQCLAYCKANSECHYVNWVEPMINGECTLWSTCGEMCLTDHCWSWWTTWENNDRPAGAPWNVTACDSLPEKPS
jgi:hypothetical protein